MASHTASPHVKAVTRHLGRLRRRAGALYGLRAMAAGLGIGSLAFALLSMGVGPVVTVPAALALWALILATALAGGWLAFRPVGSLRGSRVAGLLRGGHAELASAARSALELATDPRATQLSPELVQAHAARVGDELGRVPPRTVVPWSTLRHHTALAGLAAAALAAALLAWSDSAVSGAWALTHPDSQQQGATLAAVVGGTEARLNYPAYMGREPKVVRNAVGIEAPPGTTVRYTMRPRVDAREAVLEVAGRELRLSGQQGSERFTGRFVVQKGGPLQIRVETSEGKWLTDPTSRWLRAVADQAPRVALGSPEKRRTVELDEALAVSYDARDDVGLRSVELVVETAEQRKVRRSLKHFDEGQYKEQTAGSTTISAAEFGARRGDRLRLWIEAKDGDVVSGPKVGKSAKRTLVVASEATRRMKAIQSLKQTLDQGLHTLADRLEAPVPDSKDKARDRFERVQRSGKQFVKALRKVAEKGEGTSAGGPTDPSVYREMAKRVGHAIKREASAYGKGVAPYRRRVKLDDRLVRELEKDTLMLADLLGKARIEDSAELTRKLESLRREMHSLLAELRRADSQEARQALMGALARAQARMQELMQRLAQMGKEVPSEFVNSDALRNKAKQQSKDALSSMREAVQRGDLAKAEAQLREFKKQITSIAEALGQGESSFSKARFGKRKQAMAEALDTLAGLEAEQRKLADRSATVRRKAAERALDSTGAMDSAKLEKLAKEAQKTRDALDELPERGLGPMESEALQRARQRLEDIEDALKSGDLAEAREMSAKGRKDVQQLARDLELSALMFPGQKDDAPKASEAAKQALRQTRELRQQIDEALPRIGQFLDDGAQKQMRKDAKQQRKVHQTAEQLAQKFEKGPEGLPLSGKVSDELKQVRKRMKKAHDALGELDPLEASRLQDEAARKLTKLREELEQNRRSQSQSGGGGGQGGQGQPDFNRRVRIPGAEEHEGPMEMRRRLLDAMREDPPSEYEESVKKYYEELLR